MLGLRSSGLSGFRVWGVLVAAQVSESVSQFRFQRTLSLKVEG